MKKYFVFLSALCISLTTSLSFAKEDKSSLSTKWYLSYENGEKEGEESSKFKVGRAYLTYKTAPTKWFNPRITLDATQDDTGDWKVRLKYVYGKFKAGDFGPLTNLALEAGLVHTPWLDFEDALNPYRMKDKMTLERVGVMNSADLGLTGFANLGGKLSKDSIKALGNKKYAGKFGSFSLGIYNGSGYNKREKNNNKVFQSRLTLRPLGDMFPHLQVSHFHVNGSGNTEESSKWRTDNVMASFEHKNFNATAQYITGKGNQKGKMGKYDAYGVFADLKLGDLSIMGRYDWLEHKKEKAKSYWLTGVSYSFLDKNRVMLSYDRDTVSDDWKAMLTAQLVTKHVF